MHTRPIRFFHRGRVVEVADAAPTRSVLDWLREDARCTGTKEGCNEGDCGACTVVIGTLAAPGDTQAVRGLSLLNDIDANGRHSGIGAEYAEAVARRVASLLPGAEADIDATVAAADAWFAANAG